MILDLVLLSLIALAGSAPLGAGLWLGVHPIAGIAAVIGMLSLSTWTWWDVRGK